MGVFADHGVSGAEAKRPTFDRLLRGVARKEFDVVVAWRCVSGARSSTSSPSWPS